MGLNSQISNAVKWDAPRVTAGESLQNAIEKMAESYVSALVVTTGEEVTGVITDMDLMGHVVDGKNLDTTTVGECMTPCDLITEEGASNPCVQLDETESVENALGVMESAGVHNLLVSGNDNDRVGMVSILDLLKLIVS